MSFSQRPLPPSPPTCLHDDAINLSHLLLTPGMQDIYCAGAACLRPLPSPLLLILPGCRSVRGHPMHQVQLALCHPRCVWRSEAL